MYKEKQNFQSVFPDNIFTTREMTVEDISNVLLICRESFPNSIRWHYSLEMGVKWLQTIIESNSVEKFVIARQDQICGFCILVTNIEGFNKLKSVLKINNYEIPKIAYKKSRLVLIQIKKRIKNFITFHKSIKKNQDKKSSNRGIAWIEMIAISKKYRRMGLSKMLFMWAERTCTESGKRKIGSTIQDENIASIMMHKKFGFKLDSCSKSGMIYVKKLI